MKKILYILLFFATIISINSCKKTTSASTGIDNVFTEKIDNIKRNEPVLLSFKLASNTAVIDWQISPNSTVSIEKAGSYATIRFGSTGTYTVVAKANNKQATYTITVLNSLFDEIGTGFSVTASKLVGVGQNEDIVFTVNNPATNSITWVVDGYLPTTQIAADNKSAVISFKGGKSGTVTVSDGVNKQSRTVFINEAVSNNAIDSVPFIFGDKLNIVPSLSSDKKTLYLTAATTYNYQCNTDKILSATSVAGNSFEVSYGGVVMASIPCETTTVASCINSFANMPIGSFPFTIQYENKTYKGTIDVKAAGVYTFNFTNNSLININPLQVN